jgi:hypothetical protein
MAEKASACKSPADYRGTFIFLNRAGFLESGVGAMLFNRAEAFHRDVDDDRLIEFRYENLAALKVRLAANLAGWVELRRAGTVGVPPANLSRFTGNRAFSCHSRRMLP